MERRLGRLRREPMPPRLLDGYTSRVMDRLAPAAVRVWWRLPAVRLALAPAVAMAVGVGLWVAVAHRATRWSHRALAQAVILERLDEPWSVEPMDEALLVEDAQQVDRFVLWGDVDNGAATDISS